MIKVMNELGIKRIIVASILGIYNEVIGWNEAMLGSNPINEAS